MRKNTSTTYFVYQGMYINNGLMKKANKANIENGVFVCMAGSRQQAAGS